MRKKIGVLYTIIIAAVVAILFATTLYHFSYSLHLNSYFGVNRYFASDTLLQIGGLSSYISAFFSQNITLLIAYIAVSAVVISYLFIFCSKNRTETIVLSLIALTLLYSRYTDVRFVQFITSCLLISLSFACVSALFRRSKLVGYISLAIALSLLYLFVIRDKSVYIFALIAATNSIASRYIFSLYRERNIVSYTLFLVVLAITSTTLFRGYNRELAQVMKMEQAVIDDDWNGVFELAKQSTFSNQLTCYYTNLSLIKSGQLSNYLFSFPQNRGAAGLNLTMDYQRLNDKVYDAMGLPNQALRCTFENYIVYGKSNYNIKKLIYYYNKCGNKVIADKFLSMLPTYPAPQPTGYITTGIDSTLSNNSNFVYILETIVDKDRDNKTAYEILMAYYALEGRIVKFAEMCCYAQNHFKEGLPTYFQEVLLVYEDVMKKANREHLTFDIDEQLRKKYIEFNKTRSHRGYQNSYWYYMNYINPSKSKIYIE